MARDQRTLNEQVMTIVRFLRDRATDEDALATASRGWRPLDWRPDGGPCQAEDCQTAHDHSPHPRHSQRWQSEIDGRVDRWPLHVVVGVPRALVQLDPLDREIVDWVARCWLSFRHVGRLVGRDDKTVAAHYRAALEAVAKMVWDEDGAGRY